MSQGVTIRFVADEDQTISDVIREAMKARDWSYPDVDRHAGPGPNALSGGTLRAIASGRRRASMQMLEKIGELFDLDYREWLDWRLAEARHQLDERDPPEGVGRENALRNLNRFEEALRAGPRRRAAKRAAQQRSSRERTREVPLEGRRAQGGEGPGDA